MVYTKEEYNDNLTNISKSIQIRIDELNSMVDDINKHIEEGLANRLNYDLIKINIEIQKVKMEGLKLCLEVSKEKYKLYKEVNNDNNN